MSLRAAIPPVVVIALCAPARAQLALVPLDPGLDDVDPLAASLRDMQVDQRLPLAFERVYRVPERDDLVMRVDGALYAVFPRSVYAQSRFGPVPLIPSGTIFCIGAASVEALAPETAPDRAPSAARSDGRLDSTYVPAGGEHLPRRLDMREHLAVDLAAGDPRHPPPRLPGAPPRHAGPDPSSETATAPLPEGPSTILNDFEYRARRLRELVRRAARAQAER